MWRRLRFVICFLMGGAVKKLCQIDLITSNSVCCFYSLFIYSFYSITYPEKIFVERHYIRNFLRDLRHVDRWPNWKTKIYIVKKPRRILGKNSIEKSDHSSGWRQPTAKWGEPDQSCWAGCPERLWKSPCWSDGDGGMGRKHRMRNQESQWGRIEWTLPFVSATAAAWALFDLNVTKQKFWLQWLLIFPDETSVATETPDKLRII